MTETNPPAVWWSPSLNTVITRGDHDHVYIDEHFAPPDDAVRMVPLVILPENFLTEHDADRFAAKMADIAAAVPDTGQAREVDWPTHFLATGREQVTARVPGDTVQAPGTSLLARIEWALFGTTDGDLVEDDADLPVGEMRRLLRTVLPEPSGDAVQAPDVTGPLVAVRVGSPGSGYLVGPFTPAEAVAWRKANVTIPGTQWAIVPLLPDAARPTAEALLGTDTTPDRLAWISKAGETAAVERQARYQETACARRYHTDTTPEEKR